MANKLIEAISDDLLASPLDYILAEHFRQRLVCNLLEQIVQESAEQATAGELLDFLERDLPLHVEDEEEDLFPILRRRAHPEDEIDRLLDQLSAEHARDEALLGSVAKALERLRAGKRVAPKGKLATDVRMFAQSQRRHLAIENAVVLPVARLRLTNADLAKLTARMAERRGLPPADDADGAASAG
jgi:hemerythrin-like domain-containing protein